MANAVELLVKDHEKMKALLGDLLKSDKSASERTELLRKVQKELSVHTQIEEEIFYPAFADEKSPASKKKMYHEAKEEHRAVEKLVLPDLNDTAPSTMEFMGRAKVLKELVEHHMEEEEEEMFKMAEESMSEAQLKELGQKMAARKKELQ